MTLLEALVAYGVSKGVLAGDGVDTYRDFMPETPDDIAVFAEYSGSPANPYIDAVHRSVQVKTRSRDAVAARDKAVELFKIFWSSSDDRRVDFTEDLWGQVYVRQPPYKLSQDGSDRTIYCFNLGITTNIIE